MPSPPQLTALCRQAATKMKNERAGWGVTGPTRVPLTLVPSFDLGGANLSSESLRTGYLIDCLGFSHIGNVHWLIAGGNPSSLDSLVHPTNAVGQPEATITSVTKLRVAGRSVTRYLIAPGSQTLYADHVVLVWRKGDEEYQVSVHRLPTAVIAEAQALAVATNIIRQQAG